MVATSLYRSLSMVRIDLSKDNWEAEFWDLEGLVIWCSICRESCWGGDGFWVKDWRGINDWVDGEEILVGDEDCWMCVSKFKCWCFFGNEDRWGCVCKTLCEGKDDVGRICCGGNASWKDGDYICCCCWGSWGSFVELYFLSFEALLFGMMKSVGWSFCWLPDYLETIFLQLHSWMRIRVLFWRNYC